MNLTVIFKGILCELEEGAKIIVNTSHALQIIANEPAERRREAGEAAAL